MLLFILEKVLNFNEFCDKVIYVKLYSERGLTKMAAGNTLVASKQSVTLSFFPVKLKAAQKQKAYSVRFTMDGMRLFMLVTPT